MEDEGFDFHQLLYILKNRYKIIILCILVLGGLGVYKASKMQTSYQATIKIFASRNEELQGNYSVTELQSNAMLMATATQFIETTDFMTKVVEKSGIDLDANSLLGGLSFNTSKDAPIMDIMYTDSDPVRAKNVVEIMASEFEGGVKEVITDVHTKVIDSANVITKVPNKKRVILVYMMAGLILGIGVVLIFDFLDDRIKRKEDLEKLLDISVVAVIPQFKGSIKKKIIKEEQDNSIIEDIFYKKVNESKTNEEIDNEAMVKEKEKQLEEKTNELRTLTEELQQREEELRIKEMETQEKEDDIQIREYLLRDKEVQLIEKDKLLKNMEEELELREKELQEKQEDLQVREYQLKEREIEFQEKEKEIQEIKETLKLEEEKIIEKNEILNVKERQIQEKEVELQEKEEKLKSIRNKFLALEEEVESSLQSKEIYIKEQIITDNHSVDMGSNIETVEELDKEYKAKEEDNLVEENPVEENFTAENFVNERLVTKNFMRVDKKRGRRKRVFKVDEDTGSVQAEAYRTMRTNIRHSLNEKENKIILVTSAQEGEGKTLTAVNLALTYAQEKGKRVLLMDCNLRKPKLHESFNLSNDLGLTNLLLDENSVNVIKRYSNSLDILTSGKRSLNPAEMLSSDKMDDLLSMFSQAYDCIVIDGPSLMTVADSLILAPKVQGVLLVVRADKSKGETLKEVKKQLVSVGANIIGATLTEVNNKALRNFCKDSE